MKLTRRSLFAALAAAPAAPILAQRSQADPADNHHLFVICGDECIREGVLRMQRDEINGVATYSYHADVEYRDTDGQVVAAVWGQDVAWWGNRVPTFAEFIGVMG